MSKAGGWIPIDKNIVKTLGNIDRPYSIVEAMVCHTADVDCGKEWTINGYAKLWDWSRGKVRRFVNSMRTHSGHIADRKGTQSGHPIHFIDKGLWDEADRKRTHSGHIADNKRDTTSNPNPNPNPKKKEIKGKYGTFNNVLLTEKEYKKLIEMFNSKTEDKINNLSEGIKSKGYKYKSHYATVLSWHRRDEKKNKPEPKRIDTAEETRRMLEEIKNGNK
jgi:hypothetical protein